MKVANPLSLQSWTNFHSFTSHRKIEAEKKRRRNGREEAEEMTRQRNAKME